MHAILHLETDGTITKQYQAFEKGLCEACPCSFLIHDDRAELLNVIN
jgi:hypothetical protein